MENVDKCENCKKNIEFCGLIWIPKWGPLKDFKLRFDTVGCVNEYKKKYSDYVEDTVGYESQCTNVRSE